MNGEVIVSGTSMSPNHKFIDYVLLWKIIAEVN